MKSINCKSVTRFKKETFKGFIDVVAQSAKDLETESVIPFVQKLETEYAKYESAFNYDKTVSMTDSLHEIVDKADACFYQLNSTVRLFAKYNYMDCGAVAQAVADVVANNGYAPNMSMDARFATIGHIADALEGVDTSKMEAFGVPACVEELKSLKESYTSCSAARKILREESKAKLAVARAAVTEAYAKLSALVECLTAEDHAYDLDKFVDIVRNTLIHIRTSKSSEAVEEADDDADSTSDVQTDVE